MISAATPGPVTGSVGSYPWDGGFGFSVGSSVGVG